MNKRLLIEKVKLPESVRIPVLGGLMYRWTTKMENSQIRKEKISGDGLNHDVRDEYIIASLTSFPARIEYVHLAIKSLLLQSCKPDRVILWLANEQFPDHTLPESLMALEKKGLEIRWCDDLYGHKKYYYCIAEQKSNQVVITFDDDIIYPVDCIKRLMKTHNMFPHCLVCERAQSIDYELDGTLKNPGRWKTISNVGVKKPSYSLNPSPGGGCLIPYGAFYKDAFDKKIICERAYKNDDLWYMFMCAEQGTRIVKTRKYHKIFSLIEGSQTVQMATENVMGNKNVQIMKNLAAHYPKAYRRITTDKD